MTNIEHVREVLTAPPTAEYWQEKAREGWRPVAVEWEREVDGGGRGRGVREEVPYGLQVAEDCRYLEENPTEVRAMRLMLEQIVADRPLSAVAEELDRRGFRRRGGSRWTQVAVFNMLPRLIEMAPRIYSSEEWHTRKHRLLEVGG